ncbi:flagellar motor protein MotB, partial [Streptomyces sp. NPDC020125]
ITPPNETKALKIEWPWESDSLVDQRGATHPGTFVNPIG